MSPQQQGAFSLFPSPNSSKPPRATTPQYGRRSESQDRSAPRPQETVRADTPERPRGRPSLHITPPRNSRPVPQQQRTYTPCETEPSRREIPSNGNWPLDGTSIAAGPVPVQQPRRAADVPGRTDTSLSQANTLVRGNSGRSRSSIAKLPLQDDGLSGAQDQQAQTMRSIFPTYNPGLPLEQQAYAPTQMSPSRIPRAVISRQSYYEEPEELETQSVRVRSPGRSVGRAAPGSTWPARQQPIEPPVVPPACTTEQLKHLWRIANGWKASPSDGRVFCLKLAQAKDAPVYTLSSASSEPFYNLRLDPTSASAYVTLTRHDPSKPYKAPKPDASSSPSSSTGNGSRTSDTKNWHEALTTTLEEESRKHPPNDGLVALLMPTPATRMALEKADDPAAVMMAERECARLVWDEDTATHFLVHQALATPFCVTVERSPAYSRTEYTLEHHESPQHLAKLTRDGTGGGWIEVDTGIASKIESFYIIDVAVTALLLVAAADDRNSPTPLETFEPPPPAVLAAERRNSGRISKVSVRRSERKQQRRGKMEEFEIDVESQDDSLRKGSRSRDTSEDKLPFLIRVVVKLAKGLFKLVVWVLTIAFKCVAGVFKLLYKCVGSKY